MALGGLCLGLAAVIAFVVIPMLYRSRGETTQVLRLTQTVTAGTQLTPDMLTQVEVGSFGLPAAVLRETDEAVGKYARLTITPDDLLLPDKLADAATDEAIDQLVAEGKRLVSVSIGSIAAGVAGHLRPGDIVTIASYSDVSKSAAIDPDLCSLTVYGIENADALPVSSSPDETNDSHLPATLTLIASDAQAQKLVAAEYGGSLHVLFERRGPGEVTG